MAIVLESENLSEDEGGNYFQYLLLQAVDNRTKNFYFIREDNNVGLIFDAGQPINIPLSELEAILETRDLNASDRLYSQAPLPRRLFTKIESYWQRLYGLQDIRKLKETEEAKKTVTLGVENRTTIIDLTLNRSQRGNYHLNLDYKT